MRNLVLVLLLANAALFMWNRWFNDAPPPPPAPTEPVGAVILVDEVTAAGQEAAAARAANESAGSNEPEPPPGEPVRRCVSLGPYGELTKAATAAAGLKSSGYDPNQRVADGEIWVGYWVHISGIPSRTQANRDLRTLKRAGIDEAYIVGEDEDGFTISLGVFSEIARAGTRRQEAQSASLKPIVTNRTRQGTVYWLDFELRPGEVIDMDRFTGDAGPMAQLQERACP